MKGLELSRRYWEEMCRPVIEAQYPDKINRLAAGLIGDGSECYGFDDEISQDHDFGPRIMIWLTDKDYSEFGAGLQKLIGTITKDFLGYHGVNTSLYGEGREGVFTVGSFYRRFIGLEHPPENIAQWRLIPEVNLSIATNGEVFYDGPGEFTRFRDMLSGGYPKDLRLKKIAARCMTAAQSGQYNYPRSIKRGEAVGAFMAASEFINSAISLIYLLNNKYKPFYKWMHRGLLQLPLLGSQCYGLFTRLASAPFGEGAYIIEEISGLIIGELRRQGLSASPSDFLLDHGPEVQSRIADERIRDLALWGE
jgi:hypothetical protein